MKLYIALIAGLLSFTACSQKKQTTSPSTLTVSIEPLRYFAQTLAGDKFRVESLVPEGSNPETYDPTPQQLVSLNRSKAFLRAGYLGFEQVWTDKLKDNAPQVTFFDTSEGIDLIREEDAAHEAHAHASGVEPHVWSSPRNAYIIADNIYRALCTLDKDNTDYYKVRLDSLKHTIGETDRNIRAYLLNTSCAFLIYHPALSYFARDYGLTQISIEHEGKEPSPAHLQELIRQCREKRVKAVFVQKEFDTRNAEIIARELGIPIVGINPLNYDWAKELTTIARILGE